MADHLSIAELYDLLEPGRADPPSAALGELVDGASVRLAVYGTLAPGRSNHGLVAPLGGEWSKGWIRGHLFDSGWGAAAGYPGVVLDRAAPAVLVDVLVSLALPAAWGAIDRFEGPGYRRTLVPVFDASGGLLSVANIYALTADATPETR